MACWHTRRKLKDDAWVCVACGDAQPAQRTGAFRGIPALVMKGDPSEIPENIRIRNRRHDPRKSASEIERGYHNEVERLRDMKRHGALRRGPDDCRLAARIPGELFFAKQKQEKHYWRQEGNLEKHRDFLIDA